MNGIITRFAPSPSGYLHLGHAASATAAFGFANRQDGTCVLRIEDIDTGRCQPKFELAIIEDLAWLGFTWPTPPRRQSDHFADYGNVLTKLRNTELVYRCFKTRNQILDEIARAPHGASRAFRGAPLDTKTEQSLMSEGKPFAWRLSLERTKQYLGPAFDQMIFVNNGRKVHVKPEQLGDVILARKDVGTSYHLACCHDDALQSVTDIVRGTDILPSTHIHRLLQELMGWPVPRYHHHPLLTDANGKRFAKRDKSMTLRALRQSGASPEFVLEQAGQLG